MRKTRTAGKRIAPDSQKVNRPAKRKNVKVNGKLLAVIAAVVVVIIALCLIRLRASTNKNTVELLGTWSFNDEATYSFDDQMNGQLDVGEVQFGYSYTVSGDKLKLDYEDDTVEDAEYKFAVDGDQLTLEGGKGTAGGTYQLSRVG